MKFHVLKLFIFVIVLYSASAKRWGGGSSSRTRSSGGRWGSFGSSSKPKPSAPTSFNTGGRHDSTSSFLHTESGRPSRPALPTSFSPSSHVNTHPNPPYPTGSHRPSAPSVSSGFHHPNAPSFPNSHPSNTHVPSSGKVVHESHQQSHAPVAHNDPYAKQPAQNPHISNTPYVPSGGYGSGGIPAAPHGVSLPTGFNVGHSSNSAPYPTHLPNHPHPNPSIGSSSFPSHSQPPHSAPSFPQTHNTYPQTHSSYPQTHSQYPAHGAAPPPYHPPQYAPSYHSPPPTAPFVPGRTVYVMPESTRHSSGPGIGSVIAGGVAGGIAAGATNAIVDHAISSIFRSSPNHVHTYPSAPPVGTPTTVTHTTNNYYYGSGPSDGGNGNVGGTADGSGGVAQPQSVPAGTQNAAQAPAQSGSTAMGAPGTPGISSPATSGAPSSSTNGAVSRTPEGQTEVPPPSNVISDEDLMKFTEELFEKYDNNLYQYVDLNLQKRVTSPTDGGKVPDEAPEPLFNLKSDLNSVPTVATLRALYDNYEHDGTQKESITESKRNEVTAFIDEVVKTPVMSRALSWLVERKYVEPDGYEQKDLLRRMWFTNFDETSSGFERIFLSEKFGDNGIVGMQNWIYFADREAQNKVNYLGYVDMINLSGKGSLLKLNYESEGFTIQNATIFVGTPPELEMALYTVCFHARPNNWCPISIGGAKFFILTHSFRYFGKDLIDLGFPAF